LTVNKVERIVYRRLLYLSICIRTFVYSSCASAGSVGSAVSTSAMVSFFVFLDCGLDMAAPPAATARPIMACGTLSSDGEGK